MRPFRWFGASLLAAAGAALPVEGVVSPPVLKWSNGGCFSSWCQTGWYSSPAVADVDGDGQAEVVWGSYDLVVLNGSTGALRARATSGARVWPAVVVADLTGDGTLEIVVGRSGDQVSVYRPSVNAGTMTLNTLWTRNPFGGGEVRTLAVEDLETDGRLEVIVGRASGGGDLQLNVYDAAGNVRSGWPAPHGGAPGYGWGMYNENVTVGDLDRDGAKELIGPTDTHYITALDRGGNQLAASPIYGAGKVWRQVGVHVDHAVDLVGYANCGIEHRPNFADSAPAMGDMDGDGTPEIAVVGNVYNCGIDPYLSLYRMGYLLNKDRTRFAASGFNWTAIPLPAASAGPVPGGEDYDFIESSAENVVLADLDGDGFKELLFPSYDGRLHAYWLDKTQHGSWPYDVPGSGTRFASEPVVADLDNDGKAEVLFASWPDKSTGGVGQLHILSYLGAPLQAVNLPPSLSPGEYNGGLSAPTLANIDGDADLEVVLGTVSAGVVAYDLPGTSNARVLWGTGRGNLKRTAALPNPSPAARQADFDADRRSDLAVYHAVSGLWYTRRSSDGVSVAQGFGGPGYQPVPGDYDGDRKADHAVFHAATGLWFVRNSSTGSTTTLGFGGPGYTPLPRDYDGDGKTDIAVYHPASGLWYFRSSSTGSTYSLSYGGPAFMPLPADYDGDGRADFAVFHSASGLWFVLQSTSLTTVSLAFGGSGYTPVPGDYDGDGRADLAVYHPPTGLWYLRYSSTGGTFVTAYGGLGYTPVPGDYDADRRADLAVYHVASGLWFVRNWASGTTTTTAYGGPGFEPVLR